MGRKKLTLEDAAKIALVDYLSVSNVENLLILTDTPLRKIGQIFFDVGEEIAGEVFYLEIKPRKINGEEPPEQVAEFMKEVDVIVAPMSKSITHTDARRKASKLGVRIATMPGITEETMLRCLSADPKKIQKLTEKVAKRMETVSTIRVVTELGTNITLPMKGRKIIQSTGILRKLGDYGNLPSGEVYLAPWENKSQGVVVFDGSIAGIGKLNSPVLIRVVDGYAVEFEGDEEAKTLFEMLDPLGKSAFAIGEFGIGTNHKAQITGRILEDEKVLGTIHIALGNNITMGGKISVQSHIDGTVTRPDVYFDDVLVMEKGNLLF